MGLDISAHSKLVEAPDVERDEGGYPVDYDAYISFYENEDFPGRYEGLKKGMAYITAEDSDYADLSIGYGSYSTWREELAKMVGYKPQMIESYGAKRESYCAACWSGETGPFSEQINFSDCEGAIGPVACAKLAKDYEEFADKAEAVGGYFWDKYQEFKRCFDIGADGGAVKFH